MDRFDAEILHEMASAAFLRAKAAHAMGDMSDEEYRAVKKQMSEARALWREYRGEPEGIWVVPETIEATTEVHDV